MKTELCNFTGFRIYAGRGRTYVKADGKQYHLANRKSERLFIKKKNPRLVSWTILFRRLHKKGITEVTTKKRTKKRTKVIKAVEGTTLEAIRARRNENEAFRKEQREAALKAAKEKLRKTKEQKLAARAELKQSQAKVQQQMKHVKIAGPKGTVRVGGKR